MVKYNACIAIYSFTIVKKFLYVHNICLRMEKLEIKPDESGYSNINGIQLYYEIYGKGKPLVLIHGGGSTIQTTFANAIPLFSKSRKLICIELQAHGRTEDRDNPLSFEQDADDIATLLENLHIEKTSLFGFSNGGMTAIQFAIKYPNKCDKIVVASVILKRNGTFPLFWDFIKNSTLNDMPETYKSAFLAHTPDKQKLLNMHQKCAERMNNFRDFDDSDLKKIKAKVLLINGDKDVATNEHIVAMAQLIPNCQLAIIPGGHGTYIGEINTISPSTKSSQFIIPIIEKFLDESD